MKLIDGISGLVLFVSAAAGLMVSCGSDGGGGGAGDDSTDDSASGAGAGGSNDAGSSGRGSTGGGSTGSGSNGSGSNGSGSGLDGGTTGSQVTFTAADPSLVDIMRTNDGAAHMIALRVKPRPGET